MKNFSDYRAEDFITDPDFIRWIFEDRMGDRSFWEGWLTEHPGMRPVVEEARTILRSLEVKEEDPKDEMVRQEISWIVHETQRRPWGGVLTRIPVWKYAVISIGLIAAAALLYKIKPARNEKELPEVAITAGLPPETDGMAEEVNSGVKEKAILLPDGSKILLFPASAIRFPKQFSSPLTRDVYLTGDAFFDVAKNPDKPFRVFSSELVTKVLGTSFTLLTGKNKNEITVIVRSGKVSVYSKGNERGERGAAGNKLTGVVLTPNQELIYARKEEKFQKILVDTPVLINPAEIKTGFQYEDVPIALVIEQLKKAFDIDIVYDKEAVKNCRITADLGDESIYKKLDLICKAMDASYEMIDGVVTIQGKPCR